MSLERHEEALATARGHLECTPLQQWPSEAEQLALTGAFEAIELLRGHLSTLVGETEKRGAVVKTVRDDAGYALKLLKDPAEASADDRLDTALEATKGMKNESSSTVFKERDLLLCLGEAGLVLDKNIAPLLTAYEVRRNVSGGHAEKADTHRSQAIAAIDAYTNNVRLES